MASSFRGRKGAVSSQAFAGARTLWMAAGRGGIVVMTTFPSRSAVPERMGEFVGRKSGCFGG